MAKPTEARQDELAIREKIANRIIVDCGFDSEYPCPHTPEGNPLGIYEICPHEDKDICMWQLEQADVILSLTVSSGGKCPNCRGTGIFHYSYPMEGEEPCLKCNGTGQKQPKTLGQLAKEHQEQE